MRWLTTLGVLAALTLACDALDPYSDLPTEGEALREAVQRARQEAEIWLRALEEFRQDYGRYPSGREGLRILVVNPDPDHYPDWRGPYGSVTESHLRDPWRRPYHLFHTATELRVTSEGLDRQLNTGDDISASIALDYYN